MGSERKLGNRRINFVEAKIVALATVSCQGAHTHTHYTNANWPIQQAILVQEQANAAISGIVDCGLAKVCRVRSLQAVQGMAVDHYDLASFAPARCLPVLRNQAGRW